MHQTGTVVKQRLRRGERNIKATRHANPMIFRDGQPHHRVARTAPMPSTKGRHEAQRETLLALRQRLRGSMTQMADEALSGYGIETTGASPDTADRASETLEQDLALSLLGNATGALEQITEALERIENGAYGRCQRCGGTIPDARLEAIPYTPFCVECASRRERKRSA